MQHRILRRCGAQGTHSFFGTARLQVIDRGLDVAAGFAPMLRVPSAGFSSQRA
jgi:hypothetical protein